MGDNLLNLVVKFTSLDGLSGSLKSMIGLGRSSKDEMRGLTKELGNVKKGIRDYDAQLKVATGSVNHLWNAQKKLLEQEELLQGQIARRRRLEAIDGRTAAIQGRAAAYRSAGMSGLMGGMMMAAPMMAVVHEASAYQREMARIDALGLGSGVVQQADKFARSAHIIGNSTRDMAHAYGDAMAIFKDTHEADFVAPLIAKMKFANQALYGEEGGGEHSQALMSLMKTIEFRGGTKSKSAFEHQADFAQKVVNASRGRVDGNEMLNAMKTGGILAKTMSDKAFYLNSEPLVQEYGGNRFGTALSALYSNLAQGHGSIASQQELMRLGLLDPKKVQFNKMGMVKKTMPGAADISLLRDDGALAYLQKVLLPAFAKKGITGDNAIIEELGRIFSNKGASSLMTSVYQQREKLAMQGDANSKAMGIDGSVKVASGTFAGKSADFSAKWASFLEVAGKKGGLMDMAISGMGKLTGALDGLTNFGNRHPTAFKWIATAVTWLVGMRLAVAAGKLAFGGLLGPVGQLWGLWSKYKELGSIAAMFPRLAAVLRVIASPIGRLLAFLPRLAGVFRVVAMAGRFLLPILFAIPVSWMLIGVALAIAGVAIYRNWDKIKGWFKQGVDWIKSKLNAMPNWMKWVGTQIMAGLLTSLNPMQFAAHMWNVAQAGSEAFKRHFGIKSPSRLMMEMGGHIATGLGVGMDQHAHKPKAAMRRMATAVAGAGALALSPAAHARASAAPRGPVKIEVHIHQQPGENADALIERLMVAIERKKRGAGLSSYDDEY